MKKVIMQLVASAAILFGVVGSTSAAVSNAAWLQGTSLDGGSTDLRGTNPKLISWSAHSSIDPTAFKHSLADATQLTVTKDGDYFVAATLPIQGAAERSVDTLEVFVNDEAVPGAISRCTYIRNAGGHTESSAHIAQLIPGLKANDVITVKTYRGSATNARTDMGTASLFVELLDDGRNVFGSTSAGTGNDNLNRAAGEEDMYLKWDGVGREGSAFSAADSAITLKDQGSYLVTVNVPLQGNVARAGVGLSLLLGDPEDGEWAIGGLAQQGYIRNASGHNVASIHFSGVVNTAEANTDLTIYLEMRAAAGDVTLGGKLASIFIEKISTDGLFHATATQMFNGENWNPDNKDQVYWEEEDRVIDSNTFGHGGDDLQNIVIKKAGSYLLAYNDVLEGGNARANPRITVEVNGAEVPGAQTKSHYNRHASAHDEVSGSMVVLLENLAADDVVTVSAQREGNGGIVTATDPALLSLILKDNFSLPAGDQTPPRFSSFSGGLSGFSAIVEDFGLKLDAATLKATLNGEVVDVTVDSANGVHTLNYTFAAFPPTGSEHALNIAFNDTGGNAHSLDFAFTVTTEYQTISPAYSMSDVNKDKGGFRVNLTQISAIQTEGPVEIHGNQWVNAEKQIRGEYLNPNDVDDDDNPLPYLNEADPDAWEGWSIAPEDVDYVNMNQDEGGNIGNFGEDQMFPNIPGWGDSTDGIAGEFLTVLHLKRGFQTLGVNSDDGFSATIGINFRDIEAQQIGLFNGSRGAADSLLNIVVTEEGYYPLRVLWWEGGGGANIEIFSVVDGAKILVNDPDNADAIKAYNIGDSTGRAAVVSIMPTPGKKRVESTSSIEVVIENGSATTVDQSSVKMTLNGKEVAVDVSKSGDIVTISYTGGLAAEAFCCAGVKNTAIVSFKESNGNERSAEWSFEAQSTKRREVAGGTLTKGLMGHWPLDETDGTIASDSSGNGNDGTLSGDPQWAAGRMDGALEFDGGDVLTLPADTMGLDSDAGTVAFWVNMTGVVGGINTIWWGGDNTTGGGFGPENEMHIMVEQPGNFWNGGEFGFYLRGSPDNVHLHSDPEKGDAPGTAPVSPILLTDGLWHHIAGTWGNEDGKAKLYFNGQLLHEIPYSSDTSYPLSNIYLGQMANGVRTFTGLLDDVGIWNRALSAAEVAGVTSGGIPVPAQAVPGLIAHWPLNEGSGDVFREVVGGLDGFLPLAENGAQTEISWSDGPPTQQNSVEFSGANSFIATPFPGIGGGEPRTVAFWVRTTDADAYYMAWGSNETARKWHLRANGASGVMRTEYAGGQNYATTSVIDGEWHHVASVFPNGATEGEAILHYVDGVLDPRTGGDNQTIDTAIVTDADIDWTNAARGLDPYPVHIGAVLAHGFGRMLTGSMADVRIYDRELSEDQIRAIFEGEAPGAGGPPPPDNGWIFSDQDGETAAPTFGNEAGTLSGGVEWSTEDPFGAGGSVSFNGTDGTVVMEDLATAFNDLANFSLSIWIKANSTGIDKGFWEAVDSGGGDHWGLRYDSTGATAGGSNVIKLGITTSESGGNKNRGADQQESHEGTQTTDWQNVVMTWEDGVGFNLYIDGELDEPTLAMQNTAGTTALMDRFVLGDGAKAYWDGLIDEVAVWSLTLSADDAAWLAQNSIASLEGEAPAAKPTIGVVRNADGTVTVTYTGKLQVAPTVKGPWEDVEGATSPLTLQPDQPATFGRTVSE